MPRIVKKKRSTAAVATAPPVQAITLADRALRSAQRERLGADGPHCGLLGQVDGARQGQRRPTVDIPDQWTPLHVMERLEEAFGCLLGLPIATRPKTFGNMMPRYVYDRGDLNAQQESFELEQTMRDQNRSRRRPTPAEIARMDDALAWPMRFLQPYPEVSRAVCLAALWAVTRRDVQSRCRSIGVRPTWFVKRQVHGLRIIATELARLREPVE